MARISFLHGRADQTRVKRNLALQEEDAKVDITQHAIARIAFGTVRRAAKQRRRHRAEPLERRNPELFLAFKVVKEAAFGNARSRADVIDRAAGIALGPNDVAGRIEQLGAGFGGGLRPGA